MRITSLTISIAASLLLLGFAGSARADLSCAQQNLPEFSRDLNRNTAWNTYVTYQLNNPANQWPGLTQLKAGFLAQQCPAAWGNPRTYIGIRDRTCRFDDAPTPWVSGTTVNYKAPSLSNSPNAVADAIVKLHGCGALPVQLPAELAK